LITAIITILLEIKSLKQVCFSPAGQSQIKIEACGVFHREGFNSFPIYRKQMKLKSATKSTFILSIAIKIKVKILVCEVSIFHLEKLLCVLYRQFSTVLCRCQGFFQNFTLF